MVDISVIVPIYGVELYIERALTALFAQTKSEGVEFILVNDATADRSMEIAREVAGRYSDLNIIMIDKEVNEGVAAARQSGLEAATGEYTIHFDPDDWCEPTMLEELYGCAVENNSDIVVCDYRLSYPTQSPSQSPSQNRLHNQSQNQSHTRYIKQDRCRGGNVDAIKQLLAGALHGSLWSKLIRRSIIVDNQIAFRAGMNLLEDESFVIRALYFAKRITYCPQAFVHYAQRSGSIIHQRSAANARSMMDYIGDTEAFFVDRGCHKEFETSLNYKKLYIRFAIVRSLGAEYLGLYPEAKLRHIITHPTFTPKDKIAYTIMVLSGYSFSQRLKRLFN